MTGWRPYQSMPPTPERILMEANTTEKAIKTAKRNLDNARVRNDTLQIALAEEALNDLLERYIVPVVTRNHQREKPHEARSN